MALARIRRPPEVVVEAVPAAAPQRGHGAVKPPPTRDANLVWRAVVHMTNADAVLTTWHLAACAAPGDQGAHCPEGQYLMQASGQPDGHCLVRGRCPRCTRSSGTPPA